MTKKNNNSLFNKVETEIINEAEDYFDYKSQKIKKKIIRLSEISVLILIGFILISFGLANLISKYFPLFEGGFNYLVLGIIFIIISFTLKI